jgi:uncharacterized protein (TIGR00251 family)
MVPIHDTSDGVTFAVKIHPRARKNAVAGELGDSLKLSLTAPPVEGRANEACINFLANLLKVPRSSVTIASGQNSRRKVIRVSGLSADEVQKRLGI